MNQYGQKSESQRIRMQRFVKLCRAYVAEYAILSVEPLIIFLPISPNLSDLVHNYRLLFDSLADRELYIICCTHWYFEREKDVAALADLLGEYENKFPRFTFFILSNTDNQLRLFAENNIKSVLCSSNSMIDEKIYFPADNAEKRYDAVYDARLVDWKRHDLAAGIESLGLIYYAIPWLEDNQYIDDIKEKFARARFFNHTATGDYRNLTPSEINQYLNECRVGLCLSEEEGAMYASIQYLLAGLPVVTTPSRGGRDEFFDADYVITVEPNAEAVKSGVQEAIELKITAQEIRQRTLAKINEHRARFVELGERIYAAENCDRSFADDFKKAFFNKMHKNQNHLEILEIIEKGDLY